MWLSTVGTVRTVLHFVEMVHDSGEEKRFIYLFLLGRKECFFIICLYAHTFVQYRTY